MITQNNKFETIKTDILIKHTNYRGYWDLKKQLIIKKYEVSIQELQECAEAGFKQFTHICECTDGQYIWDEDLIEYIPYTEESRRNHEWQHSKHIIPIALDLNMTSDELLEICLEAGQRPIRHQVCQCTDGEFIWDEVEYKYIPYIAATS